MRRRTPAVWMRRLLPRELRQEYGDDFVALLQERVDEEKANRGRVAALRYWVRGFVDVLCTAFRDAIGSRPPVPNGPDRDRSRLAVILDAVAQDLGFGARQLRRNPGFTTVAVLTLALGIGVNAAVYNVVNARLRPPPVHDARSLVSLTQAYEDGSTAPWFSYPDYLDLRDRNDVFTGLAAMRGNSISVVGGGGYAEQVSASQTSANYFEVLGVRASLGRTLGAADSEPDAEPSAVVSHELWQRRFGGDPEVIGAELVLSGAGRFTVVGVTPKEFWGPGFGAKTDLWYPATMRKHVRNTPIDPASDMLVQRDNRQFLLIGRLKPGVTLEQAQAATSAIADGLARAYPEANEPYEVVLTPGIGLLNVVPMMRARFMRMSTFALVAAGIVLLIACVNISGMLLARSLDRSREITIRRSLGAGRGRLLAQLIGESLLLACAAGAVGLLLGRWTSQLLVTVLPRQLQGDIDLGLDIRVAAFTASVALVAAVLSGFPAAWRLSGTRSTAPVAGDNSGVGKRQVVRKALLAAQVVASVVLLIGAGLFARSLRGLNDVDPGFDADNVLMARLWAGPLGYSDEEEIEVLQRLLERAVGSPGVHAATIGGIPVITAGGRQPVWPTSRGAIEPEVAEQVSLNFAWVGYHRTLEIPLVLGRSFSAQDAATEAEVVVVNETMAQRLWPGGNPLGQEITLLARPPWFDEPRRVRVIGVARDTAVVSPQRSSGIFVPLDGDPGIQDGAPSFDLPIWVRTPPSTWSYLLVRTTANPTSLLPTLRDELAAMDPSLVMINAEPLADWYARLTTNERTYVTFTGLFGLLAASLCAVGIYGAMAHAVSRRTHEIGVRRALGAPRSSLVRAVVLQGAVPALVGVAIGIGVALALSRIIASLLYGVTATDPLTYGAVGALVVAVALLAAWVPARRAARVDPVEPLRAQ